MNGARISDRISPTRTHATVYQTSQVNPRMYVRLVVERVLLLEEERLSAALFDVVHPRAATTAAARQADAPLGPA